MGYSVQREVSDGTLVLLDISISYIERSEILVLLDGVVQVEGDTWDWVGTVDAKLSFTPPVGAGVEVAVVRHTDLSDLRHRFSAGAAFNAQSMDENFWQILHIAQEASEGSLARDFYGDVDMHGNNIGNVADAVTKDQAVNLGQLLDVQYGAIQAVEEYTAYEGQTVFILSSPYVQNTNTIQVLINGLKQDSYVAYTETTSTTITFTEGLAAGDVAQFVWVVPTVLADASLLKYTPAGAGTVTTTVQNKLRESVSVKDFGAVGDGVTDDTAAFKVAIAAMRDNTFLTIPEGVYIVDVDDVDVVSSGDSLNYTVGLVSGKTNVGIGGPGTIKFISSRSTRRNFLLTFKDCTRVDINTLNVEGEFSPQEGVPNSEVGIGYGVYLYNSADCLITASRLRRLIMLYMVTGRASKSVTTSNVSKRILITGNHFDTFEQNSTFGAGASDVVIDGNTFHNCFCAQKISQRPFNAPASVGAAGRIIFSNNVVTWDSTFQFSEVWFSPGKSEVPYGVQIQAHNHDVVVSGNLIDLSNCRALTLPAITDPAAIVSFRSDAGVYADDTFQPTRLKISGNTLIGHPTAQQLAAKLTPFYRDVEFTDNLCKGRVTVTGTGGNLVLKYGTWKLANNTIRNYGTARAAQISVTAGNFNSLVVKDNLLVGDPGVLVLNDRETIYLATFTADFLTVQGNIAQHGCIGNYTDARFTCGTLNVVGNTIKGIDLATTSVTRASIVGNAIVTDSTAIKLDLDSTTKASAKIKISGNACSGAANSNSGTAVNLNGGTLRVDGNSFDANAATAFVLDASVFISSGNYYGQGAPAQAALYGTLYADYNLGSAAIYMKTTVSGTTGWAKLATV